MRNPEIVKTFDAYRQNFRPYGLTCELWQTDIMPRFDCHNEIELNYFPSGEITYFLRDRRVTIPPRCLTLFWGLIPHRIVHFNEPSSYYVCTIPLSLFLAWGLPDNFISRVLNGEVLMDEEHERYVDYDYFLMKNWHSDLFYSNSNRHMVELEMQSRLLRMSAHTVSKLKMSSPLPVGETILIEQMALYIAQNYSRSIRLADIGKFVGLHPDYANVLFKKAFGHTLNSHLIMERITQSQRLLLTTDAPVIQIAYDCGFNSISTFNSTFLKFNGCTPRDYRKRVIKNTDF